MHGVNKDGILNEITRFYLESPDFNGISPAELSRRLSVEFSEIFDFLTELISEEKVGILYAPTFINPHIIRLGFEAVDKQIERLTNPETEVICLYPLPTYLQEIVNHSDYQDKPYRLALALGSAQLDYRSFDLAVLEHYRNDPRYTYETDEIKGHICYSSDQMAERNQTMLESFGFSYDSNLNRAVAVFVCYLARLSPEHQQIWKAHELAGDYDLHPDYYKNAIIGEWREHESIFTAFVNELHLICQMTMGMNRSSLFRKDYGENHDSKPKKFGFLVRPTLEEFFLTTLFTC